MEMEELVNRYRNMQEPTNKVNLRKLIHVHESRHEFKLGYMYGYFIVEINLSSTPSPNCFPYVCPLCKKHGFLSNNITLATGWAYSNGIRYGFNFRTEVEGVADMEHKRVHKKMRYHMGQATNKIMTHFTSLRHLMLAVGYTEEQYKELSPLIRKMLWT